MSEPVWLSGGNSPRVGDTIWYRWARICGRVWDLWGTDAAYKPKPTDSVWIFKLKILRILGINNDPFAGHLVFSPAGPTYTNAQIAGIGGLVDESSSGWTAVQGHGLTALIELRVNGNALTQLDLEDCTSLETILAQNNSLATLDVTTLAALEDLRVSVNSLTVLDLSGNPLLEILQVNDNGLATLDVTGAPNLVLLEYAGNAMTSIDVSQNSLLESFACYGMAGMTGIDISGNPLLTFIDLGSDFAMTTADIDNILINLDNFGLSNGTAALFGTATPSGAAAAAIASLIVKGWTLQLDP